MTFPAAALCAFGRLRGPYTSFAQGIALIPGMIGNYLRAAFYRQTLREFSLDTTVAFGTFFASPQASVSALASIGCYCVIGRVRIGFGTQIGSHVEIPSGRREHVRDRKGNLLSAPAAEIVIGNRCWIGSAAVIMAEIGDRSTVGAGSVVVTKIPPGAVAVGNPARVIRICTFDD
jgi:acetyltransferase-like isoleucine patch superfamily enzyme